jgi:hypothetical protein
LAAELPFFREVGKSRNTNNPCKEQFFLTKQSAVDAKQRDKCVE